MGCGCSSAPKIEGELDDIPEKSPKEKPKTNGKTKNSQKQYANQIIQLSGINLPINSNNILCFTVGDIENQYHKLEKIISFIKLNPSKKFVFLGDLFDDISWPADGRLDGLKCLQLLNESGFFPIEKELESFDQFREISFHPTPFLSVNCNVKFIVGNAECDALSDIITNLQNNQEPDINNYYTFGKGKYQKKFTFEQLSLLYKYYINCYSALSYNISKDKTLWFRHAARTFRNNYDFIDQCKDLSPSDKTPIICGHNKGFGVVEKNIYMNDTCLNENDFRICAIGIDEDGNIEANSLNIDFEYPTLKSFPKPPQFKKPNTENNNN